MKKQPKRSNISEPAEVVRLPQSISADETSLCKLIWICVIYQLMTDVVCTAKNNDARINREEAEAWVYSSSFEMVCYLANIHPCVVRRMFNKIKQDRRLPDGFNIQTLKEAVCGKRTDPEINSSHYARKES